MANGLGLHRKDVQQRVLRSLTREKARWNEGSVKSRGGPSAAVLRPKRWLNPIGL